MCGPPTVYSRGRVQQGVTARAEASGRDTCSFCALVTARAEASGRDGPFCALVTARAEVSGREARSFCALVTAHAEASGRYARSFSGLQVSQCLNIWKEWGGCSVLGGD